jgi:hypothetical protein
MMVKSSQTHSIELICTMVWLQKSIIDDCGLRNYALRACGGGAHVSDANTLQLAASQ